MGSRLSHRVLRNLLQRSDVQCVWTGLSLSLLIGCGQKPTAETANVVREPASLSSPAIEASPKVATTTQLAELPVKVESPPALATPITNEISPSAEVVSAPVKAIDPAQIERSRKLFESLVTPGVTIDEWDKAQNDLLGMGADAVPEVARHLSSSDDFVRETAATTLALIGPQALAAVDELRVALSDTSPFVRANAASTLVQIEGHQHEAVAELVKLLDSTDPSLQQIGAMNLNAIGSEAAPYVETLMQSLKPDAKPEVVLPVVQLLGRIGPAAKGAVPQLQQIAYEQSGPLSDEAKSAITSIQDPLPSPEN